MNTIIFKVTGNRLKRIGGYDPVSGESKYTKLRFEFDKEWSGVDTATVTMFFDIKDTHNAICEVNNSVAEADINEALRDNSGVLWVGVTGVSTQNGATLDCELVAVPVGQGTVVTEVASTKLYQQIIEYLAQIEGKLIDEDNPITTSLIQNFAVTEDKIKGGAVTPEKLDRRYWERVAEYNPIISYADLFEKVGYINTGSSIAQVVVNITTGTEGTINGLCLAYGRKSANGDTIYLINNNTGDFWEITRTTIYNEDGSVNNLLYKPVLLTKNNSITLEDGSVTPEKLDREYWQIVSRNPVIGYDYFDAILEESFAPDTIYRIHFSGLSPIYRVVGEGSFVAVTRLDCSGLMLINVINGDRWIYEKGSSHLTPCENGNGALEDGSVTPEKLDREYWQSGSNWGGIYGTNNLDELITDKDWSANKIYRLYFDATGAWGPAGGAAVGNPDANPNLYDHEVIAIPYTNTRPPGIYILDMTTGCAYTYTFGDDDITPTEKDTVIDIGSFNTMQELKDYPFEENKIYRLLSLGELNALLESEYSYAYWQAIYWKDRVDVPSGVIDYLYLTNLDNGDRFRVGLGSGFAIKLNKADQTYNPESENAQSGIAVAESLIKKLGNTYDDIPRGNSNIGDGDINSTSFGQDQILWIDWSSTVPEDTPQHDNITVDNGVKKTGVSKFRNLILQLYDEGDYFTNKNVEGALQELGSERIRIREIENTATGITLSSGKEYRFTSENLHLLNLDLPSLSAINFECSLVFKSGDNATRLTCPSQVKWSGDDVASVTETGNGPDVTYNCLVPQKNKTYNVIFWYDGFNVNAVARGVSND